MTKRLTAIHEAGHVAALLVLEMPFTGVTIEPGDDYEGAVHCDFPDGWHPDIFRFDDNDEDNKEYAGFTQRDLENRLMVLLAGEAAQFIETGNRDSAATGRDSWEGDFAGCMELMERIFMVTDDPDSPGNKAAWHYTESIFWRTVVWLQSAVLREKVNRVADALLENGTLSPKECAAAS